MPSHYAEFVADFRPNRRIETVTLEMKVMIPIAERSAIASA